jgi:hypothetical protein
MTDNLFEPIPEPAIYDMTEQMQQLLNPDYPVPDPAWDYATLWQHVMRLQQDINALVQLLSQQEHASPEADQLIRNYLNQIGDRMIAAHHLLPASNQTATGSYILDGGDRGKYRVNNGHGATL